MEGGRGTEQLTDVTPTIIVNIPLDTVSRLTANIGVDFYASASTDRIDFALSTPSSRDTRLHADFGYTREQKAKGTQWGAGAGFRRSTTTRRSTRWAPSPRPRPTATGSWALRARFSSTKPPSSGPLSFERRCTAMAMAPRQSYNVSVSYSQVLTKRLQVGISTELV